MIGKSVQKPTNIAQKNVQMSCKILLFRSYVDGFINRNIVGFAYLVDKYSQLSGVGSSLGFRALSFYILSVVYEGGDSELEVATISPNTPLTIHYHYHIIRSLSN